MPEIYCSPSGWLAEIFLRYEKRRDITRLVHREQQGPLMVQRPFYPEQGVSHTYLLHPPGGVVGGDVLKVGISVGEGAHALITTPGATKFYRSAGAIARQVQDLVVDKNGFLEWLPQENIFFPAATAALKTQISLTSTSRFIGWEIQCFGRPVLNEVFSSGLVTGHTQIRIDNKLILAESLYVDQLEQYRCAAGMRDFPMMGSLYISPSSPELFALIHECIARFCKKNKERLECGITDVDGLLVIRTLGYQTEPMMACFVAIWQAVREHWLGYTPEPPRIWAT